MDAVRDVLRQGAAHDFSAELAEVFSAYEMATNLQLCFRPTSDRWTDLAGERIEPRPYDAHRSDFCRAMKARAYRACTKCDVTDLPEACAQGDRRRPLPFVRTCHAGVDEILIPLWQDNILVAVLFAGQFRREKGEAIGAAAPRQLSGDDLQRHMRLLLPVRAYLMDVLERLDEEQRRPRNVRHAVIESCIREGLASGGPSLRDVAERLSLSPSRASHVIRESSGRSFRELVEEHRITLIKDLLVNTNSTVASIAYQSGLKTGPYLSRYFKSKVGLTPSEYREIHRRSRDV